MRFPEGFFRGPVDLGAAEDLAQDALVAALEGRVALTLRMLGGLTTAEIARAFLVPEPTVAQRIVRAKRALADARVPFEVPRGPERDARLASVLEVLYLVFNEGYSATAGEDWVRPALCEDAIRLGRVLANLAPEEAEVHGLVALMEIQASRIAARVEPSGDPILLMDRDRSRWDQLLIRRGLAALERAEALSADPGPYALQAALADALLDEPLLRGHHLLPSVRGDLLFQLGRLAEARTEFERAAALAGNARDRELLLARVAACDRA